MSVELIYDSDCPNVSKTRANLLRAFADAGQHAQWNEWDRNAPDTPARVKQYGSPTILVNGRDIAGEKAGETTASCRLYKNGDERFSRAPSIEQIADALCSQNVSSPIPVKVLSGWKSSLSMVPGIGVSLLPVGLCPACWPAYVGLAGSLGLGFLLETKWLFPLMVVFLLLAVGALAFRARTHQGYGPFVMGIIASAVVLLGKFLFNSGAIMYGGIGLLITASVWNAWPKRKMDASCPASVSNTSTTNLLKKEIVT